MAIALRSGSDSLTRVLEENLTTSESSFMTRIPALVLAGLVVLGGYVAFTDAPTQGSAPTGGKVAETSVNRKTQRPDSVVYGREDGRSAGVGDVKVVKVAPDFDGYIEWGSTPDRPAQSIGEDIDAEDLSIVASRPLQVIGEPLDVEDIAILDTKPFIELGPDIDVDDLDDYEATIVSESVGEELDAQLPQG